MSYPLRNTSDPATLLFKNISRLLYRIESRFISLICQIFLACLSSLNSQHPIPCTYASHTAFLAVSPLCVFALTYPLLGCILLASLLGAHQFFAEALLDFLGRVRNSSLFSTSIMVVLMLECNLPYLSEFIPGL